MTRCWRPRWRELGAKPPDDASQAAKKRYSERVSEAVALVFAQELRERGMRGTRPLRAGGVDGSGAERRMAGGIGAKKVDVTWATEESGLLLGISIKSINFRDPRTGNFQKNLTNRRGDMLMEAVTLHRRFPYAVLAGFFFLDAGAETDSTQNRDGSARRRSTFLNAHARMKLFTGRDDPAGRDEQVRTHVCIAAGCGVRAGGGAGHRGWPPGGAGAAAGNIRHPRHAGSGKKPGLL